MSVGGSVAEIASGPTQIADVIARLNASAEDADSSERMFCALVEPGRRETTRHSSEIVDACNVFVEWLGHAAGLLSPAAIDLQAGYNKVKHGLAVRARSDMRVTFVTTPPNADGSIPLGAFTGPGAVDIFDQPVLELLARGPKVDGYRQGLEITQLRLKPSALLADAYMLAMAHGVLFHIAAVEHFAGREDLREYQTPPPFPGYPVGGPRPTHIDAHAPLGMRFPLTMPPGGGQVRREAGIGFRDASRSSTSTTPTAAAVASSRVESIFCPGPVVLRMSWPMNSATVDAQQTIPLRRTMLGPGVAATGCSSRNVCGSVPGSRRTERISVALYRATPPVALRASCAGWLNRRRVDDSEVPGPCGYGGREAPGAHPTGPW